MRITERKGTRKKITIKITGKHDNKTIKVRKNLTMNNLKVIIVKEMLNKWEDIKVR